MSAERNDRPEPEMVKQLVSLTGQNLAQAVREMTGAVLSQPAAESGARNLPQPVREMETVATVELVTRRAWDRNIRGPLCERPGVTRRMRTPLSRARPLVRRIRINLEGLGYGK